MLRGVVVPQPRGRRIMSCCVFLVSTAASDYIIAPPSSCRGPWRCLCKFCSPCLRMREWSIASWTHSSSPSMFLGNNCGQVFLPSVQMVAHAPTPICLRHCRRVYRMLCMAFRASWILRWIHLSLRSAANRRLQLCSWTTVVTDSPPQKHEMDIWQDGINGFPRAWYWFFVSLKRWNFGNVETCKLRETKNTRNPGGCSLVSPKRVVV